MGNRLCAGQVIAGAAVALGEWMAMATKRSKVESRARATAAPAGGSTVDADFIRALIIAVAVVVYAIVIVRTAWLSDDSYITFRTIDNFIHGYGLRWNVAERVQPFTHPLWLFVLSAAYFFTREIYFTALLISIGLALATFTLVAWQAYRRHTDPWILAAGLGVLIVSRAFVDYSTSGLENPLTHLLLVVFVILFLQERDRNPGRLFLLGLVAGLATLNRMDTAVLLAPALGLEIWQTRSWKSLPPLLLGFAPFLLWEAFSIVYYGFPFPNTAYAKLRTGIGRLDAWQHGLAYLKNSLVWDPITLLAIGAGLIAGVRAGSWRRRALAAGGALYVAYVVHIGGDFMTGRFLAAPLLIAAILLVEAGSPLPTRWLRRALPAAVVLVGFIGSTPTLFSGSDYGRTNKHMLDDVGVANERAYYYPKTGLLSATPWGQRPLSESRDEGKKARLRADPVVVEGAVGFLGFFAGPHPYVLDYHALGDPLLSQLPMVGSDPLFPEFCILVIGHPCTSPWRIGHYLRNIPAGYIESVIADENLLADAQLRQLYEVVRLITRAPIWSRQRWRAIWTMNTGGYDDLLGPLALVDYQPTPFAAVYERYPDISSTSVLRGAARNYIENQQLPQAIESYQKLVAIDPGFHDVWNNLGNLLLWKGDAAGGEAALLEAIKLRPRHMEPYKALAEQMEKSGRRTEMLSLFQRLAAGGDAMAGEYLRRLHAPH